MILLKQDRIWKKQVKKLLDSELKLEIEEYKEWKFEVIKKSDIYIIKTMRGGLQNLYNLVT